MIGILYESHEWSDYHLASELEGFGCPVEMIDAEDADCQARALECDLLVSRVFASAYSRGHDASLARIPVLFETAERAGVRVINPARAHAFETSKARATEELGRAGIPVPHVFGVFPAGELAAGLFPWDAEFPLIVKPDCGGRGGDTFIVRDAEGLESSLSGVDPRLSMVVEEYVEPAFGYLTRIEIVGGEPALVLKRSVAANGLSGYHHGSVYGFYPECPQFVLDCAREASAALSFELGSFDVIESQGRIAFIDCNSVSNASEDCTDMFQMDLLREHARYIAGEYWS